MVKRDTLGEAGATALISVFNKDGIEVFGKELLNTGYKLLSSGGTAKFLKAEGLPVKDVVRFVGKRFLELGERVGIPEEKIIDLAKFFGGAILDHKVATLNPDIYAGLLASYGLEDDEMMSLAFSHIDLVCCDLYPLEAEIARDGSTIESVREQTDIGGPSMIRAGAKGRRIVVCDAADRSRVIRWIRDGYRNREAVITALAAKAENVAASYCQASADYLSAQVPNLEELLGAA